MTADIAAFIRARLDEWEASAVASSVNFPSPWDVVDRGHSATVQADAPNFFVVAEVDQDQVPGMWTGEAIDHIARHDPASVLRQVAAARRRVHHLAELAASCPEDDWPDSGGMELAPLSDVARFLLKVEATIWADHPDYAEEWKP